MRKHLSRIGYSVPLSSPPSPYPPSFSLTYPAIRFGKTQHRPRSRHQRERLNMRLRRFNPLPIPSLPRHAHQGRTLHITSSDRGTGTYSYRFSTHLSFSIRKVLLRSLGFTRGFSRPSGKTSVFPILKSHVLSRVYPRRSRCSNL